MLHEKKKLSYKAIRHPGFTLIEILVVVAIIAVLISILLPSLARARSFARRSVCMNNQRELARAFFIYSRDHNNLLPGLEWWIAARMPGASQSGDYYDEAPDSGQLFGQRPTKKVPDRGASKNYIANRELFLCPVDRKRRIHDYDRNEKPYKTFSYSRNAQIVYAMQIQSRGEVVDYKDTFIDFRDYYYRFGQVKYPDRTPLLVEESAESEMDDGEFCVTSSGSDRLTDRHDKRAIISYHDTHVEPVYAKDYNEPTYEQKANHDDWGHYRDQIQFMSPGY
jgi:prepilin-type N-terminal cleavage/methylation domain-containing protein